MTKKTLVYLYIAVAVYITCRVLTLNALPLLDPSEGRYAQVCLQMASNNDYITPFIWYKGKLMPYNGKPPLFFWCGATFLKLFGKHEFTVRLISFMSSLLILSLIVYVISKYRGFGAALSSTIILCSMGGFFFLSGAVLLDMTLCLFSFGAYLFYFAFENEENLRQKKIYSTLVFIFLALGILSKGPVVIVIFGLPVFLWTLFNNRWKNLKDHAWLIGGSLFLLISVPWFLLAERQTPGFLHYFFINENFARFITKSYGDLYGNGHEKFYGTSILYFIELSSPWSVFAILFALYKLVKHKKSGEKRIARDSQPSPAKIADAHYFLFGFLGIVLFWCFAKQILPYYLLYSLPAFAIWLALLIDPYEKIKKMSFIIGLILIPAYALFTVFISHLRVVSESKSAAPIITKTMKFWKNNQAPHNLIFTPETPYSAYFYGEDKIVSHPPQRIRDTLDIHNIPPGTDPLYFVDKKYIACLTADIISHFDIIAEDRSYAALHRKQKLVSPHHHPSYFVKPSYQ